MQSAGRRSISEEFPGMDVSDFKRLRALENENAKRPRDANRPTIAPGRGSSLRKDVPLELAWRLVTHVLMTVLMWNSHKIHYHFISAAFVRYQTRYLKAAFDRSAACRYLSTASTCKYRKDIARA